MNKFTPLLVVLILALQVQKAEGFLWCFFFGIFSGFAAGPAVDILNDLFAGVVVDLGVADSPYTGFQFDGFNDAVFEGCSVSFGATFTVVGTEDFEVVPGLPTVDFPDITGGLGFSTTFDILSFLFGGFNICFTETSSDGLTLTFPTTTGTELPPAITGLITDAVNTAITALIPQDDFCLGDGPQV